MPGQRERSCTNAAVRPAGRGRGVQTDPELARTQVRRPGATKTDFSCGAAALATILRQAYWLDVDEHQIIEGMLAHADQDLVRTQGFSMLDMKRYVESLGMRARGYRVAPETLHSVRIPVVVLMDVRGYKHFVVMQKVDKGWVYIGDPVLGHKRYKVDDFLKGWNGIIFAVIGQGYDKNNILLDPPLPLTAKGRVNNFTPCRTQSCWTSASSEATSSNDCSNDKEHEAPGSIS